MGPTRLSSKAGTKPGDDAEKKGSVKSQMLLPTHCPASLARDVCPLMFLLNPDTRWLLTYPTRPLLETLLAVRLYVLSSSVASSSLGGENILESRVSCTSTPYVATVTALLAGSSPGHNPDSSTIRMCDPPGERPQPSSCLPPACSEPWPGLPG